MILLKKILILSFISILLIPWLQYSTSVFPSSKRLSGVTNKIDSPSLNIENWWDGKFQKTFSKWVGVNLGFRNSLIRLSNHIDIQLFRTAPTGGTNLVLGLENWIYEASYVREYNREKQINEKYLLSRAIQLHEIQEKLKKRNISFIVILAPSKAHLYPEYIPPSHLVEDNLKIPSNRQNLVKHLEDNNVVYLDAVAELNKIKNDYSYDMMAKTGGHWNYFAACKMLEKTISILRKTSKVKYTQVNCSRVMVDKVPLRNDLDLFRLLNIEDSKRTNFLSPHTNPTQLTEKGVFHPRVHAIGDSYLRQFFDQSDAAGIFCRRTYDYYHRSQTYWPKDVNNCELKKSDSILDNDIIIIEATDIFFNNLGFGALKDIEKLLL